MMKTISNTKKVFAGLILAMGGLTAGSVSAAPIMEWDWVSDGGFDTSEGTCNNGPTTASCNLTYDNVSGVTPSGIPGTASVMTWGTGVGGGPQSGLQAVFGSSGNGPFDAQLLGSDSVIIGADTDPVTAFQQIVTNGGWFNTGAAVHYNNVITIPGGAMETSSLSTTFQLLTPAAGPVNLATLDINFNETPNVNPCTFTNPHGTICDDIFTLTGALDPVVFTIGEHTYRASFRLADGPGAIVIGNTIYTAEESPGVAVMYVQARIDTVPLPGILALMGMGLVMMGLQVRGRRRKVA